MNQVLNITNPNSHFSGSDYFCQAYRLGLAVPPAAIGGAATLTELGVHLAADAFAYLKETSAGKLARHIFTEYVGDYSIAAYGGAYAAGTFLGAFVCNFLDLGENPDAPIALLDRVQASALQTFQWVGRNIVHLSKEALNRIVQTPRAMLSLAYYVATSKVVLLSGGYFALKAIYENVCESYEKTIGETAFPLNFFGAIYWSWVKMGNSIPLVKTYREEAVNRAKKALSDWLAEAQDSYSAVADVMSQVSDYTTQMTDLLKHLIRYYPATFIDESHQCPDPFIMMVGENLAKGRRDKINSYFFKKLENSQCPKKELL